MCVLVFRSAILWLHLIIPNAVRNLPIRLSANDATMERFFVAPLLRMTKSDRSRAIKFRTHKPVPSS